MLRECGAASHILSIVGEQREMDDGVSRSFLSLILCKALCHELVLLTASLQNWPPDEV